MPFLDNPESFKNANVCFCPINREEAVTFDLIINSILNRKFAFWM